MKEDWHDSISSHRLWRTRVSDNHLKTRYNDFIHPKSISTSVSIPQRISRARLFFCVAMPEKF